MKIRFLMVSLAFLIVLLTGCGSGGGDGAGLLYATSGQNLPVTEETAVTAPSGAWGKGSEKIPDAVSGTGEANEGDAVSSLFLDVGTETFRVTLYDNGAVSGLLSLLPATFTMHELNSNEKYAYISPPLPAESERVGDIHAGDLMLYGSDCLVLFYEDFVTSYSYTRIGYMEDVSGLAEALCQGSVEVSFGTARAVK